MNKSIFKFISPLCQFTLLIIILSNATLAGECTSLIQEFSEYLRSNVNGLSAVVTTNQGTKALVSYAQMPLHNQGAHLVGRGQQYFSNRSYYSLATKVWAPFNPQVIDDLQIFIYRTPVKIEFRLNSWEGAAISSIPSCEGSVMFGTFNGGDSVYSLSFNKYKQIP